MGTPANHFIDVILEAPTRNALASWFNNPPRDLGRIWIRPSDIEGPDDLRKPNNWNSIYVAAAPELKLGPPNRSLWYLRMLTSDYDAMIDAAPPSSAVNIIQVTDKFAPLTFADSEAPTEAELNANNVWFLASQDNTKRDKIREYWPHDDGDGGTRGLKFGAFDENVRDFKGAGEV